MSPEAPVAAPPVGDVPPAGAMGTHPSGAQFEIARGGQRAVIVEVGGGLRSYSADGRDLLDPYGADDVCPAGRGQVLVPWPNRVRDGLYGFAGRRHQLALTEPDRRNAIHGLVRWAPWTAAETAPDRVVMRHVLRPQPGYPFSLDLSVEYVLADDGLRVAMTATNIGADPCPYGAGMHPYVTAGTARVDDALLRVPAGTVLWNDRRGIPAGSIGVEGTPYDFRTARRIGPTRLDDCFTDLERGPDGLARVELRRPEDTGGVGLWVDPGFPYLMLFTGDPLPEVGRRSLAVEPMTCPPDAFRSGVGLVTLEPGAAHRARWGVTPLAGATDTATAGG